MRHCYSLVFFCFFIACNSNEKESSDTCCDLAKSKDFWFICDDSTGTYFIRGQELTKWQNDLEKIVAAINTSYIGTHVSTDSLRNDTLYLRIDSSIIFTQQMGSTGALEYKAGIVFSLTENPNVKGVFLNYEEGDHGGSPGYYTRDSFASDFVVKACPE